VGLDTQSFVEPASATAFIQPTPAMTLKAQWQHLIPTGRCRKGACREPTDSACARRKSPGHLDRAREPPGAVDSRRRWRGIRNCQPAKVEDAEYAAAVKAIRAEDYPSAIRLFQRVVARDSQNADAYNWLAYATRKNGDAAAAIPIYEKAYETSAGSVKPTSLR
jgi:TolA-binding protein